MTAVVTVADALAGGTGEAKLTWTVADRAMRNSVFFERGLHATSICGAVGAAVAVAMLQGKDEAGIASAAGIAASMGAGLLEANRTGGTVKRVYCGWAARCGVAAAGLARHGLTGPPTVLEGRFGFLQAFCGDRAHPDAVVRGLGTDWELPRVVFKPYPCNHFTHAGVDAALRLRAQGLAPADVTAIELGVAKPVLRTIAEPPEAKARPASAYNAAFSGPTRSPRRCSAAASACPTRTSPTPPPVTPAASPWPPWCAASRTSAAARRSRTPSPPSCA